MFSGDFEKGLSFATWFTALARKLCCGAGAAALDASVGGQTDGIRCVIAFIEHGFGVDQIRGVEAFRVTGNGTGHAFPRLRAG